jgi:hypothetical protein
MSKDIKMKLYKALIRPVVTYGAQACTLRTVDEQALRVVERKVLRHIGYMVLSVYKESGG